MANIIIVLNVKYVKIVSTLVNQLEYVVNTQRKTVCPSPYLPDVANSTCFRNHLSNGVWDNSKSCDTCGQWFVGQVLYHVYNLFYCSYCSKSVKPDHQCFIKVKKRSNVKSWKYVFYDFECTQNMIDTETKQPVHEVNYCIAMSICDKCPDDIHVMVVCQFIHSVD